MIHPVRVDPSIEIRDARDDDAAGLIALIGATFAEYPGCVLEVDHEMPQLKAIATAFAELRGRFWTAQRDGVIVGCGGIAPAHDPSGSELKHLYVAKAARRMGVGTALTGLVEAEAARRGAAFIELWSDTRFLDAHRLYERLGYARLPDTRELNDLSNSVEFHFIKKL
ncbi:MAG: GNAT family N-acetyltransferase [Candidatus Eremiobacteraeota bacterium]|nr:GNAT family N-acetyltransferase [Candidatus Eremiobacteraeota bacterium]